MPMAERSGRGITGGWILSPFELTLLFCLEERNIHIHRRRCRGATSTTTLDVSRLIEGSGIEWALGWTPSSAVTPYQSGEVLWEEYVFWRVVLNLHLEGHPLLNISIR